MKCPLTLGDTTYYDADMKTHARECLQEKCGVWDEHRGVCVAISTLAELRLISESLAYMLAKMPKEVSDDN